MLCPTRGPAAVARGGSVHSPSPCTSMETHLLSSEDAPAVAGDAPSPRSSALVVVGLGASAGGFEALERFFAGLPETDGVAFVVILHLPPDKESRLADLLQSGLPLPVTQVTETVAVEPGHVYVIPPDRNLVVADGRLALEPIEEHRVRRRPIDHFFRTLAKAYGERGVGVVLSGTGSNGTVGVRALKEAGGFILAQDPADALYDEMPRTAITSGVVDAVGPAGALAAEVLAYAKRLHRAHLPASPEALPEDGVKALQGVLAQLRVRTGHDFAHYKRATVLRRLDRRLHVTGAPSLSAYLDLLRKDAAESEALLSDLLICVTNFFRDAEAFATLEQKIPALLEEKGAQDEFRVWVAGCATGEEAYAIAMLLLEHAAALAEPPRIQVFATDLSREAIQTARAGVYPASIEADVSPERLRRFFSHTSGQYRVVERLREAVLFAPHSMLSDPPFSRMDLVSCRNVLIYFQRDLQRQALALFHYALAPGGLLFLGTSESTDIGPELFGSVDKKARLFRRLSVSTPPTALPHAPHALYRPLPADGGKSALQAPGPEREPSEVERVHRTLREETAPPSVLVSAGGDVVHASEGAAPFLQVTTGTPTQALARVLRPELRAAAQTALFQARRENQPVTSGPVSLGLGGELLSVTVQARPAPGGALIQVVFDVLRTAPVAPASVADGAGVLAEALRQAQEQLQVSAEEFETNREEMRVQNEELQSVNEELRSTAEELETSKEEAQSMAEELRTVNEELKGKVYETARAKGDLENLITATEIATLFLDRALCIQRFTPRVRDLFHVLASDVGRPLGHLAQKFGGAPLVEDAEAAIERLEVKEREVQGEDGRWHLVHARPYRTTEDRIDGVVITFVDITRRRADEAALRQSEARYRTLFGSIEEGFCVIDILENAAGHPVDYRFVETNPAFERLTGLAEVVGETGRDLPPGLGSHWAEIYGRVASTGERTRVVERSAAMDRWFEIEAFRVGGPESRRVALLFTDVTQQREDELEIRRLNETLEARVAERTRQVRQLSQRLAAAEQAERQRIGLVLHDDLQQHLAGLAITHALLWKERPSKGTSALQAKADEVLGDAIALTRTLAAEISPPALDSADFSATLRWLAERKRDQHQLDVALDVDSACDVPSAGARTLLYNALSEILFNVAKHAGTQQATIRAHRDGADVVVTVEDEGGGFDADHAFGRSDGLGLLSVRERIEMAGGRFELASAPGQGTRVTIAVPADEEHGPEVG